MLRTTVMWPDVIAELCSTADDPWIVISYRAVQGSNSLCLHSARSVSLIRGQMVDEVLPA